MRYINPLCLGSRVLAQVAGLLLLIGIPAAALADNMIGAPGIAGASAWTVYAFGNAQAVTDAFRALANFTASSTFQSIVGFIAVLGILSVGASSGFSSMVAKRFIGYAISVFLITYIFFGVGSGGPLVVQVEVYDTVDGTWVAPVTVPAVVGIPASVVSTAGHVMTQQIEASFSIPDALKMGNGAPFNLAASMISDAAQARIADPNLASSMAYYVQDCFTAGVARGDLSATTLISSTNFLQDMKWTSASVMVNTSLDADGKPSAPDLVSCTEAWARVNKAVDNSGTGGAAFLKNASAWAKTPMLSVVNSSADAVAQFATNSGITDGGALIKQSAVLATFTGAFKQSAAATGNSDFLTGLNIAQAQQTQISGWITGAEVFNRSMGYVYAILQVFVYAVMPLVLAAALVPGLGFALIKNFGQILLWLAIWQPMLSIVNFIVLSMQQADLGGVLSNGAGAYGFTLSNMGVITEKTSTMRAAALFIGTMVPALAWSLVKGSVDFSRFIGEAAGEKFAHSASNSMVTGNYSLNQGAMDSFTANKHSTGHTGDWGQYSTTGSLGAMNKSGDFGGGKMAIGDQQAGVKNSADLATTAGTNQQHATGDTRNALNTTAAGDAASASKAAGTSENTNLNQGSGTGKHLNIGASMPLAPSGRGGVAPSGPAGPGDSAAAAAATASLEKALARVKPGSEAAKAMQSALNLVKVSLSGDAHSSKDHTYGQGAQTSDTGQRVRSGTLTDTASKGANVGDTAATTRGTSSSERQTISGVASLEDRVEAMHALRFRSGYNMTSSSGRGEAAPSSPIEQTMAGLNQPGAIAQNVAKQEASVAQEQAQHEKKMKEMEQTAQQREKENREKAQATQARAETEKQHGVKEAKTGVIKRGADAVLATAEHVRDTVVSPK